ncbi:MAG: excalibur calcium-binding domain-containing protein [Gammaproteobacteria bacterium]|nr:excalibur calcium-binding domain-containing protein [Gammaproteobacteria bacterium]
MATIPKHRLVLVTACIICVLHFGSDLAHSADRMYRGVAVAPEHRCSPYDRKDYPYPQSVELEVIESLGGIVYGPYTGTCFKNRYQTDIEHVVSLSEAHDSGLCARSRQVKRQFATDLLNLTLASPSTNRHRKSAKDLAEWIPKMNACWYAARTLEVRRKYGLTIDSREANAIEHILSRCKTTAMAVRCVSHASPVPQKRRNNAVLKKYDDNGNGRITCREARRHGIAPVHKSHPAYAFMHDGDGDGTVCE